MVNSRAEMSTGRPQSRSVADVTGPMDDIRIPSSGVRLRCEPSSSTKFLTVDELVKVTTFGRLLGLFKAACSRRRELSGTMVS